MRSPRLTRHAVALAALAVATTIATTGCSKVFDNNNGSTTTIGSAPYTEGSGKIVTETRRLAEFHAISAENGVTVFVRHGSTASVDVAADDNLTGLIATDVAGGALTVHVTGSLITHNPIKLTVTSTSAVDDLRLDGGTTLDVEDLSSPSVHASLDGGSTLRAGGTTVALRVDVDGGSTADMTNVTVKSAEASVNGGSTAILNVTDVVSGSCHGGSTLKVSGGADTVSVEKDTGSTVSGS
jgi:hypothetical protein